MRKILLIIGMILCLGSGRLVQAQAQPDPGLVGILEMDMMILPGTSEYLEKTIAQAAEDGAKILIVKLDTPGGILTTSQEMIQELFKAPIPVAIYVAPTGATATSAGVFITLAGHVAAMAPGTTIGAAHPVSGEGKDIEGDMRTKVENMTVAMVKSISEQRGRNVAWAEKSVKESSSITESEALKMSVVDLVADDIDDLLRQIKGRKVKLESGEITLGDFSKLPKKNYEISFKDRLVNVLANPNIAALLWLGATTGLSLELYNPGAILPGVVGVICLILALAVSQIIPLSQGGILLIIVGGLLIGLEFFVPSGILGVGGVIAMVLGSIYLVDIEAAPGLSVNMQYVIPMAVGFGLLFLGLMRAITKTFKGQVTTGFEGLVGETGKALENFSTQGKVFVNGEVWNAVVSRGVVEKDAPIKVVGVKDGLLIEVEPVK